MPNFFLAKHCLKYYLTARHKKGYGIHSPFLFDYITKGLGRNNKKLVNTEIEKLHKSLKQSKEVISVNDLGAGSKTMKTANRKIASIAKYSVIPLKYRLLITKTLQYFRAENVLELGTSLGITSAYIAKSITGKLISIEGDKNLSKIAVDNMKKLGITNMEIINDEFSNALHKLNHKFDAIIIDGNHKFEPTIKYFDILSKNNSTGETIYIFDDIYWSEGMAEAWNFIKKSPRITLALDFCRLGIAFENPGLSKQDFIVRY